MYRMIGWELDVSFACPVCKEDEMEAILAVDVINHAILTLEDYDEEQDVCFVDIRCLECGANGVDEVEGDRFRYAISLKAMRLRNTNGR